MSDPRSKALTCEDFGLDFKHSSAWCPVCWSEELQSKAVEIEHGKLEEMKRANNIKEQNEIEHVPYDPTPKLPLPPKVYGTIKGRGVVPIEPRRD